MTMTLVSTVTVGAGGASSIVFSSIPQTGTDLLLVTSLREDTTGTASQMRLNLNGVSTNHSYRQLLGTGSGAFSYSVASSKVISVTTTSNTASTFSNNSIYIPNYTSANNKSYSVDNVTENNATGAWQDIIAGLWSNTAAITSITLTGDNNLLQYSTASLYTIQKGSGGASVA